MIYLDGSYNSRYYAYHEGKEVSLFRDDHIIWRKEMPYERFKILGVTNAGNIVLLCEEGIYIYLQVPDSNPEFIERYSREALKKRSTIMGKALVSDEGDKFFIECVSPKQKGLEKIFASKAREPQKELTVNMMDLSKRRHAVFYEFPLYKHGEKRVMWNASRTFNFFIVAEPRVTSSQTNYIVSVINVETEEIYKEFEVKSPFLANVEVNDEGTALAEVGDQDSKKIEIYTVSGDHFTLSVSKENEVLYLGRKFVAFKTYPIPSLVIKTYENNLMCQTDLRALDELEVPYRILFDSRDHIDFLYLLDKTLKITKTEIGLFITEARRWQRLAEDVKQKPLKDVMIAREEEEKKAAREQFHKKKQEELESHLKQRVNEKKIMRVNAPVDVESSLEELRFQYILGNISEDEYLRRKEELEGESSGFSEPLAGASETEQPLKTQRIERIEMPARASRRELEAPEKAPNVIRIEMEKAPKEPATEGEKKEFLLKKEEKDEIKRVEMLLSKIEERFILGQVSEESYKELKVKYEKKLQMLKNNASVDLPETWG